MSVLTYCASASMRIRKWLRELAADRRGVAAVEFALVLPLLLSLYFVTIEVSRGIETNKKVGRVASTIADLVTQQRTTTRADLKATMLIGKAMLKPYGRSNPTITITAIEITDEDTPRVRVAWWGKFDGTTFQANAPSNEFTSVHPNLEMRGTFLIRVETDLGYKPVLAWTSGQNSEAGTGVLDGMFKDGVMNMQETYYLRPRMSQTITCSDCAPPKS